MPVLPRNSYLAFLVLIIVVSVANATTVLYIVMPDGIAIGADGKTTTVGSDAIGTAVKIFLLKKRLAVAEVGLQHAVSLDGKATLYDFPTWIGLIDDKTGSDSTVAALSSVIEDQASITLSFAHANLHTWALPDDKALVQYIVAGYDAGVPVVYEVAFDIDWKLNLVTPNRIDLLPVFRTRPSMISSKERGRWHVEEQSHGGADDRGAEATGSGA